MSHGVDRSRCRTRVGGGSGRGDAGVFDEDADTVLDLVPDRADRVGVLSCGDVEGSVEVGPAGEGGAGVGTSRPRPSPAAIAVRIHSAR
ncbi:Hypothetical protein SCLAV_p0042 (plasmid) [Streptomyces clavuligerus]|uniref:Uncharacterized protein n=1 Tax=Streptomyces clavuligerus TaxID=1901 RepID=B5GVS5_STRCL|nr:hypothetical protein SSCG_03568 [Streptomyces clavuligerus]EFG03537.1 Hypothetical protein SCLAV_p0042 [Streptomyces clavuligerus]